MVFSENQVRHLYIANAISNEKLTDASNVGSIKPALCGKLEDKDASLYFQYMSPKGLMRSDLVPISNIRYINVTPANQLKEALKASVVLLNEEFVQDSVVVPNKDFILKINFRQFFGMSDEDVYFKYGVVHSYKGMTLDTFYTKMVDSLKKNFSRELTKVLNFEAVTAASNRLVTIDNYVVACPEGHTLSVSKGEADTVSVSGTTISVTIKTVQGVIAAAKANKIKLYISEVPTDLGTKKAVSGIIITEEPQEWARGLKTDEPVFFEVFSSEVDSNADNYWGIIGKPNAYDWKTNGTKVADMEYFFLGERGDFYRNVGFPNVIISDYLVDPTKDYDILDIQYYFEGEGVSPQKSEKTLSVAMQTSATGQNTVAKLKEAINSLLTPKTVAP